MRFEKETFIAAPPERVWQFHELPDAFERLVPPWENAKIIQRADISKIGSRAIIEQNFLVSFLHAGWLNTPPMILPECSKMFRSKVPSLRGVTGT